MVSNMGCLSLKDGMMIHDETHLQWGGGQWVKRVHHPGFTVPRQAWTWRKTQRRESRCAEMRWVWNHQTKQTLAVCGSCVCCSVLAFNRAWSTFDHVLMNIARCRITLPSNFLGLDHCDFCSVACRPVGSGLPSQRTGRGTQRLKGTG